MIKQCAQQMGLAWAAAFARLLCVAAIATFHAYGAETDGLTWRDHASRESVLVVAHRADWRNFPENSLPGIESAIAFGVDMAEIDLHRTKDGHFVLMHDETVDRTTTGNGKVADLTLSQIRMLRLRDGLGMPTPFTVPTLREALEAAHGRVLLNLDKSYPFLQEIVPILDETSTKGQVVFKGTAPVHEVLKRYGDLLGTVAYMPVIRFKDREAVERTREWLESAKPPAIEFVFSEWSEEVRTAFALCREADVRIWVNTLWPQLAGGLSDDLALSNPDEVYGTLLDRGVTMLQTDRPRELKAYLARRALLSP